MEMMNLGQMGQMGHYLGEQVRYPRWWMIEGVLGG